MKYLCLVYGVEEELMEFSDAECKSFGDELEESGRRIAAEAIQPVDTAATVRVREGDVSVPDGPVAEAKEQLAGFYLIDARDMNHAIRIASEIPPARAGSIEVRPVRQLQP